MEPKIDLDTMITPRNESGTVHVNNKQDKSPRSRPRRELVTQNELRLDHLLTVPLARGMPTESPRSVNHYKAVLKMRGAEMDEIFSKKRQKPSTLKATEINFDDQPFIQGVSGLSPRKPKPKLNFHLPDIREHNGSLGPRSLFEGDASVEGGAVSLTSRTDKSDRSDLDSTLTLSNLVDIDSYQHTPGRRPRCRKTRGHRLGDVVSSGRLRQLLEGESPLRMENFYNYYP